MNVLSLFDGIGCGRIALERAEIRVDKYFASEIDKDAISIATHHYSDIIELGTITEIEYDSNAGILYTARDGFSVGKIDLVIGGSPCTDFSSIGKAKGMKAGSIEITSLEQYLKLKEEGIVFEGQSYLFWEFIRLLREIKPKYFLLENVVMAKRWKKVICDAVGCEPIQINSSLLSAQNRPRLYWTNIRGIENPEDRGIKLKNILNKRASNEDVSSCLTVQRCFPKFIKKYGYIPIKINPFNVTEITDKACALSRGSMVTSSCATLLFVKDKEGVHIVENRVLNGQYKTKLKDGRYNLRKLSFIEMERLQTLPDNYTNIENIGVQKRSAVIGNGWTVDVIAYILSFINKYKGAV